MNRSAVRHGNEAGNGNGEIDRGHLQYSLWALGSGLGRLDLRNCRGAIGADKFGPDEIPCLLAERPATQRAPGHVFAAASLSGIHVPAPRQALVEVLLVNACERCKAPPLGRGHFLVHASYGSDSLDKVQAIRYEDYGTGINSDPLENRRVETNNERRLRKLKLLCTTHGLATVAETAGLKPVYIEQIIKGVKLPPKKGDGSRSERALGDSAARAIEEAYQLGRGWFDNDEEEATMSPKELELLGLFRQLNDEVTQGLIVEGVRDALGDRSRQLEGIRKKLAPAAGGNFVGGRSSGFGALESATKTRTHKR